MRIARRDASAPERVEYCARVEAQEVADPLEGETFAVEADQLVYLLLAWRLPTYGDHFTLDDSTHCDSMDAVLIRKSADRSACTVSLDDRLLGTRGILLPKTRRAWLLEAAPRC